MSRSTVACVSSVACLSLTAAMLAGAPAWASEPPLAGLPASGMSTERAPRDAVDPDPIETVGPIPTVPSAQGRRWPVAPQAFVVLPRGTAVSGDQPWVYQPRFADIESLDARIYDISSGDGPDAVIAEGAFERGWWRIPKTLAPGRSYGVLVEKRDADGQPSGEWQGVGTFNVSVPGALVGPSATVAAVQVSRVSGQAAWSWEAAPLAGPAGGVRVGLSWAGGQGTAPGLPEGWRFAVASGSPWAGLSESGEAAAVIVHPDAPTVRATGTRLRATVDYPTDALAEADGIVLEQRVRPGKWKVLRRIDAERFVDSDASSRIAIGARGTQGVVRVGIRAEGVTVYSPASDEGDPAEDVIDGAGRNSIITSGDLPEIVTLSGWDGSLATYVRNPLGVYEMAAGNAVAGFVNSLTRSGPGEWELTDADGVTTRFLNGRAVAVEARGMLAARMSWDADGRLLRVTNEIGRTIELGYADTVNCPNWSAYGFASVPADGLCAITYPDASRVEIGYVDVMSGGAQIALVKSPGNEGSTLGWDSRGRIVATRSSLASRVAATADPTAAKVVASIAYDGEGRAATLMEAPARVGAERVTKTLSFPDPSLSSAKAYLANPDVATAATAETVVTSGDYRLSSTAYLDPTTWRAIAERDPIGRTMRVDPAANGRVEWAVSADGLATRYNYNELGAVVETRGPYPAGGGRAAGPTMETTFDATIDGSQATPWSGLRAQVYPQAQFAGHASAEFWEADRERGGLSYAWSDRPVTPFSAQASGVWTPAEGDDRRGADDGWVFAVDASSDADVSVVVAGRPCVIEQGQCVIKGLPTGPKDVVVQVTRADASGFFGVQAAPVGDRLSNIPLEQLTPGYLLSTRTTSNDSLPGSSQGASMVTVYDDPALALASQQVAPGSLVTRMSYEDVKPSQGQWGRLLTKTTPGGRVQTTAYWPNSGEVTPPEPCTGTAVASGQAKTIARPDGTTMTMYYDVRGLQIAGVITGDDGATQTTCMAYDAAGATVSTATYDADGALMERADTDRAVGGDPRVTSLTVTHGPAAPVNPGATVVSTRTVDLGGREVTSTDMAGTVTTSAYDALDNVISRTVTPPVGSGTAALTFTYAYRSIDAQLESIKVGDVVAAALTYDASTGRLSAVAYPDGITAAYVYDGSGAAEQVSVRTDDPRFSRVVDYFTRSTFGRIERQITEVTGTEALTRTRTYDYDAAGRLASASIALEDGNASTFDYGYGAQSATCPAGYPNAGSDALRTSGSRDGIAYTSCYDAQGRLVSTTDPLLAGPDGTSTVEHDAFGRVIQISGPKELTFEWSYGTQVATVREVDADGSGLVATTFDTYGSKILDKTVEAVGSATTVRYAGPFDLTVVDGRVVGTSAIQYALPGGARVTTAPGAGATLTVSGVSGAALVQVDVPELATGSAAAPQSAGLAEAFGPYGEPLGSTPAPSALPSYGWKSAAGQETLAGSASVTLIGARPYHPALGQFLAPDPNPEAANNAYSYTSGDPINASDPDGQEQQDVLTNVVLPIILGVVTLIAGTVGTGLAGSLKSSTAGLIVGAISTIGGAATGFLAAQGLTDDIRVQIGAAILGAGAAAGLSWGSYRLGRGPSVAAQKKAFWAKLDKTQGREPITNDMQFEVWQKWDRANPGVVPISNEPIVRANRASLNPFSGPTQGAGGISNQKWQGHEWIAEIGEYADRSVYRELQFKNDAAKNGMWSPY